MKAEKKRIRHCIMIMLTSMYESQFKACGTNLDVLYALIKAATFTKLGLVPTIISTNFILY